MRLISPALQVLLFAGAGIARAASWGFEDATLSISSKGAGVGAGRKEKLTQGSPLSKPLSLGPADSLKIILTTTEGKTPKRPHQAFLTLTEVVSGLEDSYVFTIKESGKAVVQLTHKDLPSQFLTSSKPLAASFVIASFGSSTPYKNEAFELSIKQDPNAPISGPPKPLRYGKLDEIHHIFRPDPKSAPLIITLVFTAAVLATLPLLGGVWLFLGASVNHLPKALSSAPISHVLFFGSIVALEGVFFLYYTVWKLYHVLPVAAVLGTVAFLSGSRALSEVQERRMAGLR